MQVCALEITRTLDGTPTIPFLSTIIYLYETNILFLILFISPLLYKSSTSKHIYVWAPVWKIQET